MKIHVLGGHGGLAKGFAATSFLIDNTLLVDAGGVASTLSVDDQAKIDNILITHCHLDHIKDLAFLCDNCFGMKPDPFHVFTHETVKGIIKAHLLNDIVWPDFTLLPSSENPTIKLHEVMEKKPFLVGDYSVTGVKVNHAHDAMGYFIEKAGKTILFTGDTGPTEEIWKMAHQIKNLAAIFTEVSFPNRLQNVANLSDHHTADSLKAELKKMPDVPVILTHLKPNYQEEIMQEISLIGKEVQVLINDGVIFNF